MFVYHHMVGDNSMKSLFKWHWSLFYEYMGVFGLKRLLGLFFRAIVVVAVLCLMHGTGMAQQRSIELSDLLEELVVSHDRIKASEASLQSTIHQLKSARGQWLPQVDASGATGRENVTKPGEAQTQMTRNEMSLTATQLLYDFGSVPGTIDAAEGQVREYEALLAQTRQEIIALGIVAYLQVIRSRELLKYARRSEESIKELSGMQEILVERGAGYSYEELQVKGQLAGAQAYRVSAERQLKTALNNFKAVFDFVPTLEEVDAMSAVPVPRKFLPGNQEEAITTAFENNPTLLETKHTLDRLKGNLRTQEATFYPQFDAVLEGERKENDQGSYGVKTEWRATVEVSYNLFSGFQDTENISSVSSEMSSARRTLLDRQRTVEEGVRNAWLNLTTLRENAELYENQANITWEFLGLVKKKKATGEEVRLLDILVGERDYINAISAKIATDIDIIIAGYTLLYEMGLINKDITEM